MPQITLVNGGVTVVDDHDFLLVRDYKWIRSAGGYVVSNEQLLAPILMHRIILRAAPGEIVDHINGDPMDNRRSNLRLCSHAQNMQNRKRHKNNKSGVKGVYLDNSPNRVRPYRSEIRVQGVKIYLGHFQFIEEAAAAYALAAAKHHGEFARVA